MKTPTSTKSVVATSSETAVTLVLEVRTRKTKPKEFSYEQMLQLAKKNPPPQEWFDADFSGLRGPKSKAK
jgi:hypothetical protein